jgi:(2R)-ethylmalonyl-CoA mutase
VDDPKLRQFRYGVQVNSLGLTAQQPENNAWRILIEALGVTLSRDARCRSLQLPTWNEALSLPRPWDQQWSLRLQQILAYETDLLEYGDLFAGSPVVAAKVEALCSAAHGELGRIAEHGGIQGAIESGYCKQALVGAMAARMARIERGEQAVVGVNRWTEGLRSPLVGSDDGGVFRADPAAAEQALAALAATRARRDPASVKCTSPPLMEVAVACAPPLAAGLEPPPLLLPLNSISRESAMRASKREAGSAPTIGSCPAGPSTRSNSLCAGFPSSPQIQICSSR